MTLISSPAAAKILRFAEINDFLKATNCNKQSSIADFFILRFEELPTETVLFMQPYQKDFYQIALILQSEESSIQINNTGAHLPENLLYFISPEHIFSWKRDLSLQGFAIYFKPAFLSFYRGEITTDFPFFQLTAQHLLPVRATDIAQVLQDFYQIEQEYHRADVYRLQILQAALLVLLYRCKGLYEPTLQMQSKQSRQQQLLQQFKNVVNNCFLTHKKVQEYADYLAVSSGYLNEVVRAQTGKTAKAIIAERVVLEAQNRLRYDYQDVNEIAYQLGFAEPTHFIRFFKKYTTQTPKAYREKYQ